MAQTLYHAWCGTQAAPTAPTMAAASLTLPFFFVGNTDTNCGLQLKKVRLGFGGTGNASVSYQICATAAATALGTSSTATIQQVSGRAIGNLGISVAGCNYTAARTTETYAVVEQEQVANNVSVIYDYPGGDEPDTGVGVATNASGFAVFFALGTTVSLSVDMWVMRI